MKTLHPAYRIRNLERSSSFYARIGFQEIGRVEIPDGAILLMLNLPGDGDAVTLELVCDPGLDPLEIGDGFSQLAVQTDDLAETLRDLTEKGIAVDGPHLPGGEFGPKTAFAHDPDGYRIELVEWPAGHPASLTRADFQS